MRAAQPHLNAEELGETLIIVPPLNEQKRIAEWLQDLRAEHEIIKNKVLQELDLLGEFKRILIAEAVTGKIKI